MITKPTVLILGAGASMDFGFPSGRQLLLGIGTKLRSGEGRLAEEIKAVTRHRIGGHRIVDFSAELLASNQPSVDAFLEQRTEYTVIGKLAIAQALMRYEIPEKLERGEQQSWYEYLFQQLTTGGTAVSLPDNRLSVITFNYDRSLEQFLAGSLEHSYGVDRTEALALLKTIPIVHVYGSLGEYGTKRQYTNQNVVSELREVAEEIKIVSERGDGVAPEARELLEGKPRICLLGFSYNPVNLQRLFPAKEDTLEVYGSRYQMGDGELEPAYRVFGRKRIHLAGTNDTALDTLKKFPILI